MGACFCVQEEQRHKQVREQCAEREAEVSSLKRELVESQAEASNTRKVQQEQIRGLQKELIRYGCRVLKCRGHRGGQK